MKQCRVKWQEAVRVVLVRLSHETEESWNT
jgi:hypothetical protein